MRASDIIRQPAYDRDGQYLGTVVDLVAEPRPSGALTVVAVVVSPRWHGRLLGYERREVHGPWLLEQLARLIRRGTRTVPWHEVTIGERS